MEEALVEIVTGVYLGILSGLFPALITFGLGFSFRYFTGVAIPGLGVVVLGGTLAGVSGGLLGLLSPEVASSWTGVAAVLVILMACLWAHSQGDKLGEAFPRVLSFRRIRESRLSTTLAERMDSFGQIRLHVTEVADMEGYPPLPTELRQEILASSWKFPAELSIGELESRVKEQLVAEYEVDEVAVTIDRKGGAHISAAPATAGLSRRVPSGKRAVTIETILPTGVARNDQVTLELPDGDVTGPVVSARTAGVETAPETIVTESEDKEEVMEELAPIIAAPKTTGGEGHITLALPFEEAKQVVKTEFTQMSVGSQGKRREYEVLGVLQRHGNHFEKVTVEEGSLLEGTTIGAAGIRSTYDVAILAIRRLTDQIVVPMGETEIQSGDVLIVVGQRRELRNFEEAVAR